jgi:hypothetical protein
VIVSSQCKQTTPCQEKNKLFLDNSCTVVRCSVAVSPFPETQAHHLLIPQKSLPSPQNLRKRSDLSVGTAIFSTKARLFAIVRIGFINCPLLERVQNSWTPPPTRLTRQVPVQSPRKFPQFQFIFFSVSVVSVAGFDSSSPGSDSPRSALAGRDHGQLLRHAADGGRRQEPAEAEGQQPLQRRVQPRRGAPAGAPGAGGAAGPDGAGPGRDVRARRRAGARRVRRHVPVHGGGHAGAVRVQVDFEEEAAVAGRRRGRAPGGGHHAPHAAAPQHRQPPRRLRGRRRRAPSHGALRGRGALRQDCRAGPLHRARRRRRHAHHRGGGPG